MPKESGPNDAMNHPFTKEELLAELENLNRRLQAMNERPVSKQVMQELRRRSIHNQKRLIIKELEKIGVNIPKELK